MCGVSTGRVLKNMHFSSPMFPEGLYVTVWISNFNVCIYGDTNTEDSNMNYVNMNYG